MSVLKVILKKISRKEREEFRKERRDIHVINPLKPLRVFFFSIFERNFGIMDSH